MVFSITYGNAGFVPASAAVLTDVLPPGSTFVSATGDIEAVLGVGVEDILVRNVPLVDRGPTVYVRFGHRFPMLCWILGVLIWFGALLRPVRS